MDLKSDDIFDIDASIWLSYELDKLNLDNQLDIESAFLSVESSKLYETTNSLKDTKNQDLKMSVTNVQSAARELTQETELERRDINGNEESSSDENLNQLFDELDLSDSDNEAVGEDDSSDLIERGPAGRRVTNRRHRTNPLQSNERYDKSQFPAENLQFWSGSTIVQLHDTPVAVNEECVLSISEITLTSSSDSLSSPSPGIYEDLGASAFGSPESGYESSITGSPPHASSLAVLDFSITEDEDDRITDLLSEDTPTCALIGPNVLKYNTDDKDHKKIIEQLVNYLKGGSIELSDAYSHNDCVSLDVFYDNTCSGKSSPHLRNGAMHKKIEYKLETKAKTALFQFLSGEEYRFTLYRLYQQIIDDVSNKREIKIIQVVDEADGTSENRTNLHHAVINSNIEEIYGLVEIQKQYKKPLSDINIRDKYGKTALDYAVKNNMTLVIDYLKENTACQSVNMK